MTNKELEELAGRLENCAKTIRSLIIFDIDITNIIDVKIFNAILEECKLSEV